MLLDSGVDPETQALVLEHLTHENESITNSTLGALAEQAGGTTESDTPFSDISILAIRKSTDG